MATRVVEGKKPYTGGEAIDIDQNKVISLKLRDENNLIIYDSGDDEIYVDLQLPDGITPTDAFPVGVTTGRAVVADGWDKAGTIICAKTTSGDNIKLLYADDGTLWTDNGTGTYKEIPLGGSAGADIEYVTQVEYDALPSSKLTDGKHYVIYTSDSPTPPSPGWQPGVNTIAYYPLTSTSTVNDMSGNSYDLTNSGAIFTNNYCEIGDSKFLYRSTVSDANFISGSMSRTYSIWVKIIGFNGNSNGYPYWQGQDFSGRVWGLTISSTSYGIDNRGSGQGIQTSMYNNYTDWHLITTTYDSDLGIEYLYLDGVLQISKSQYVNTSKNSIFIGKDEIYDARLHAQISDFIIENKSRTVQEISDYYNQTKANYGIS